MIRSQTRKTCMCGCGGVPAGKDTEYLPGHDGKWEQQARRLAGALTLKGLKQRRDATNPADVSGLLILRRAIVHKQRPRADPANVRKFTNVSGIGQAYNMARKGTTIQAIEALCIREGIKLAGILRTLRKDKKKNYTWIRKEDNKTGRMLIIQNP